MVVGQDAPLQANRRLVSDLAAAHRLPAIYRSKEFVEAGGLVAYGPNYVEFYRHAATYVDKILKGAKPEDLPVATVLGTTKSRWAIDYLDQLTRRPRRLLLS